ncbi:MAG: lipopolysaccharide biosynthesis protein, partial [Bradymonadia bacterium]
MTNTPSLTMKTLILSFGKIVASVSALLISIILARALTVEDYALHKKAILAFGLLSPVLMLGLPKALYFFLPIKPERGRTSVVANLSLLAISGGVFAVSLCFVFGQRFANYLGAPSLVKYWWIVGIYGFAMLPLSSLAATLVAQNRVGLLVKYQTISQTLLVTAMALAAWQFSTPFHTLSVLMIWSLIAVGTAVVLMMRSTDPAEWSGKELRSSMREQLKYAVPLGLASMFGSISTQLDKFMVSNRCSPEEFSWYVAGAIELPIIGIVTGSLSAVILPEFTTLYQANKHGEILALWRTAMERSSVVLIPCFGGVLLFAEDLVTLMYTDRFLAAATPFMVYGCLLPLRCAVY